MKVKLDDGAFLPERAHGTDAGMDIRSRCDRLIKAHTSSVFHTGVHVQLPHGTAGLLVSKSGLNVKHGITSTGLIDEGYTGEIAVKLYNNSDADYVVRHGDKISQLVIFPVMYADVKQVQELEGNTERGENGFGSSGR